MTDTVIYSDFNCPFCYATHARLDSLGLAPRVEWRGVEHAPGLPAPMRPAEGRAAAELRQEVEQVRALAPEVPIELPPGKPSSGRAILVAAALARRDAAAGERLVRELYRRLWVEGEDISDEAVLARALAAASPEPPQADAGGEQSTASSARGLDFAGAAEAVASWRREWLGLGLGGVPLMIRADARILYGLPQADALGSFLAEDSAAAS